MHVLVKDSGKSLDNKTFKVAIPKTYYDKNTESIETRMKELYFTRVSSGALGVVVFTRKLMEDRGK